MTYLEDVHHLLLRLHRKMSSIESQALEATLIHSAEDLKTIHSDQVRGEHHDKSVVYNINMGCFQ